MMKKFTWCLLLLPTIPSVSLADTPFTTSFIKVESLTIIDSTGNTTTATSTAVSQPASTAVNASGVPVSASQTTVITADPAVIAAPTTAISADPAAIATPAILVKLPIGPRPGVPNKALLPEEFKVHFSDKSGFSRKAFKGSSEKTIPVKNNFTENPGCYISCFTKDAKQGALHLIDNHYLIGQIRVSGQYYGGMCLPKGFENKDIRTSKEFKEMCEKDFPEACSKESCTVGSNTGNMFNYN